MIEPVVRYRSPALLVVDKPAGMLAHPVTREGGGTLADWVRGHCEGGAHLVGRLDRDTSGLVLVARDAAARRSIDRRLGAVSRRYLAVVDGTPPAEGEIDAPIGRDPDDPPLRAVRPDGAPSRTRFRRIERFPGAALVELELGTGRTHQIRVHMTHLGHPLLGDRWYGRRGLELIGRQALHAHLLAFPGPEDVPVTVDSPLPDDMAALLDRLRRG